MGALEYFGFKITLLVNKTTKQTIVVYSFSGGSFNFLDVKSHV